MQLTSYQVADKRLTAGGEFNMRYMYCVFAAVKGNEMACQGQYVAAIEFFTKAIQLDSSDYR